MSPAQEAPSPRHLEAQLVRALGVPFVEGNRVEILRNGVEIFPGMLEAIAQATESVDFLTFVYWQGDVAQRFADALADAAERGLRVRVLLDGMGALPMEQKLIERIERAGGQVIWFRPVRKWTLPGKAISRTHRKVMVCDGDVGFTGGVGIGEEWEGDAADPSSWRETHFRVRGPAVLGLEAAFLENWLEATGDPTEPPSSSTLSDAGSMRVQVIRSRGGLDWSDRATLVWTLLGAARRSIRISTPYFVLDERTAQHFVDAAQRGVEVSILVPGPHIDHRVAQVAGSAHYEQLLDAGVRLYEYQPTMIHQKVAIYDGAIVCVGSGNLNQRSHFHDHEIQLLVADDDFASQIDQMLDEDFGNAEPIHPGMWKRRSWLRRVGEVLTRPFSRQM